MPVIKNGFLNVYPLITWLYLIEQHIKPRKLTKQRFDLTFRMRINRTSILLEIFGCTLILFFWVFLNREIAISPTEFHQSVNRSIGVEWATLKMRFKMKFFILFFRLGHSVECIGESGKRFRVGEVRLSQGIVWLLFFYFVNCKSARIRTFFAKIRKSEYKWDYTV